MRQRGDNDDSTVAAIGLMAMCTVTVAHEALGHGSMCLALGGHILRLTSSLFRCDIRSPWIDPAGPAGNLLVGTLALWLAARISRAATHARLLCLIAGGMSCFWEAGYVIDAMRSRSGDWYFALLDWLGQPTLPWRIAAAATGVIVYAVIGRVLSRSLLDLCPAPGSARRAARICWIAATAGAALAALAYRGPGWTDFRDAVLEIGASSFPLLLVPRTAPRHDRPSAAARITRSRPIIVVALAAYALFVATLGRGLGS